MTEDKPLTTRLLDAADMLENGVGNSGMPSLMREAADMLIETTRLLVEGAQLVVTLQAERNEALAKLGGRRDG